MPFVYSTLAADNEYADWAPGAEGGLPQVRRAVTIKGGAGVADKRGDTVYGVVTEVTDEELAHLKANVVFNRHLENGFVTIADKLADPEGAAADMQRDPGGPLTDGDYTKEDAAKPTNTGKGKK